MVVEIFSLEHGRNKNNFVPKRKNNSCLSKFLPLLELCLNEEKEKEEKKKKNKTILFSRIDLEEKCQCSYPLTKTNGEERRF